MTACCSATRWNAAAGISASNIAIIDSAEPPTDPSSPNLAKNLAIALAAGLVGDRRGPAAHQFDDAVRAGRHRAEAEHAAAGCHSHGGGRVNLAALADAKSVVSEGYNSLRSLLYSTVSGLPKTLLITSSQPAEGKSTTSLAVARGIAKLGRRVVLLDVDLRRPALHASIGVPNEHGMSTC
jgi:hypothetical protein